MSATHAAEMARNLYYARRDRKPIAPLTDAYPTLSVDDGYAVQAELLKLLVTDGEEIAGYKVGLTSRAIQQMFGVGCPAYGPVLRSTIYRGGDVVSLGHFIQPKLETEIVFEMATRLCGPGVTVDQAHAAVRGARAGMEIADSRIADWRIKVADSVADLASTGGVVVSNQLLPLDGLEPHLIDMTLSCNGKHVGSGTGADVLDDPLAVLVWLANVLGEDELALEPGQIIMTGALHPPVPIRPGDEFHAESAHLGPLTIRLSD